MKILVKLPYMLGDSIVSSVFLQALLKIYPDSTVDVIVNKKLADLGRLLPGVSNIILYSKEDFWGPLGNIRFGRLIRRQSGKYDIYFCLHHSFSSALVAFFARSRKRVGYRTEFRSFLLTHAYAKPKGVVHFADDYINLLSKFVGKELEAQAFRFPLQKPSNIDLPLGKHLIFNVNTASKLRSIPIVKAVEIINMLKANFDFHVILTGTTGDEQYVSEIVKRLQSTDMVINLAGKTDLLQLADLLGKADLVISADTGAAHLANAFGTKLLVLFSSADERRIRPFNKQNMLVAKVNGLSCAPCHPAKVCKHSEILCLTRMDPEKIRVAVQDLIAGNLNPMVRFI